MKNIGKYLLGLLLALPLAIIGGVAVDATNDMKEVDATGEFRIYLRAFDGWTSDSAKVHVHYYGGSSSSTFPGVEMNQESSSGLYYYDLPSGTTGLNFVRASSDGTSSWNQTNNITIPADITYCNTWYSTGYDNGTIVGNWTVSSGMYLLGFGGWTVENAIRIDDNTAGASVKVSVEEDTQFKVAQFTYGSATPNYWNMWLEGDEVVDYDYVSWTDQYSNMTLKANTEVEISRSTANGTHLYVKRTGYSDFLTEFDTAVAQECEAANVTEATWTNIKNRYTYTLADSAKESLKTASGDSIQRYEQIVRKYGYEDFLGRGTSSSAVYLLGTNGDESSSYIAVFSTLGVVGLSSGAYLLLRKKKRIA